DDDRLLGSHGSGRRPRNICPRRCIQLWQGAARPGRRSLARLSERVVPRRERPFHSGGRWPMIPMQDLVERVLTHSIFDGSAGLSAGVVTRSVTSAAEVPDLVTASELAARKAGPADDAAPLVQPYQTDDDWSADPARTSVALFERFADGLGAAFAVSSRRDRLLFGFAEHSLTSTFVASSTGLRRRFDQPTGRVELNAKSADYRRSAWNGVHTRDFTDVDIGALTERLNTRLDWAATTRELPPGRYETILPPTAVADLMLDAYWTASARDAEEGRSVFSRSGGDTRIGERLSELPLTLRSDPDEPGLRCAPFEVATASAAGLQSVFDNGAPVEACSWIANGELSELIRTRSWGA